MTTGIRASWLLFWRAVWSRLDPAVRLQDDLDRLHAEYREERARRFERYERGWRVKREAAEAKVKADAGNRRVVYFKQGRVG